MPPKDNPKPIGLAELIYQVKRELLNPDIRKDDPVPLFAVDEIELEVAVSISREATPFVGDRESRGTAAPRPRPDSLRELRPRLSLRREPRLRLARRVGRCGRVSCVLPGVLAAGDR